MKSFKAFITEVSSSIHRIHGDNAPDNPALREAFGFDYDAFAKTRAADTLKRLRLICQEINAGKGRHPGAYADRPGANLKLEVLPASHYRMSTSAMKRLQDDGIAFVLVVVRPGQSPEKGNVAFVIRGADSQHIINAHAYFTSRYTYQDVCGTVEHPDYSAMVSAAGL